MKRRLTIIAAALLLAACADSHRLMRGDGPQGIHLNTSDSLFIAVPDDGSYGAETYKGSGQSTAQVLYSAFAKHTHSAKVAHSTQSFDDARATAKSDGQKYLIYPTILHWEDRATEWSMIPDKIEVKVEVVEVSTGNVLSAVVIAAKSGVATLGGNHPQDLLPEPIEEYAASLY